MYKPHLFAEILSKKSRVRLVHETIALKGSKLACRGHKLNWKPSAKKKKLNILKPVVDHCFQQKWWLLKEPFVCIFRFYTWILLASSSFKRFICALFEQLNSNWHGISIPPHSCLQCRLRLITSMLISPLRARTYHAIRENLQGKWPTVSSSFTTFMACLSIGLLNSFSNKLFPDWWFPYVFINMISMHSWCESERFHVVYWSRSSVWFGPGFL